VPVRRIHLSLTSNPTRADPAKTRYGGAVDIERAADLYVQGWTLRQVANELALTEATVSDQLRRAGVTMRRSGPPAHSAATDQILELRDQGLSWNEVAKQVDMTVSGAWSRYRKARPPKPPRLGRWQRVLADATKTLRLAYERPSLGAQL
jgi:predicted DNA-binding transcriptional regulator AlpA